ncbi:class II aldolase/adducin family protein [Propionibacterium sp. NM47_B9-13]|jgi:L-fuculose-phosphate aldolase|uniref:Class II aldolase n=1 Tax=Cutibacterium modestum TaxID=2559073 RepID=A0AAD1NWD2_9ACTN|nr:class II aldolase/adducin family protein [Cutibacterium modestum]TGY29550.1 class II aldolase/adducin family protein [Propionibacterium sp. NM47_B9-13]AOH44690.1 fuculose phosphate aldolase [Cutibacterium modestum]EFS75067.1 putative L-ribulose-5-phosphate 4-epimerase [Cutibacterium modestum HL037PA2]EFT15835.1 putative L-ribulose-5-phosphate 4-epimerase [Cutibacterium modestum HL037PA3]EGG26865.1 putative L-ribulose-5-phosphate 4-epimerase [Cutibacterium modestum P08]
MILEQERQAVVDACHTMQDQGLTVGTAGNVSIRVDDLVVISPSAVPYDELTAADIGVHRLDGSPVEARYKPSSELPLHLSVYHSSDVVAITHNHAPASTALGLVVDEVPCSHYYSAMFEGTVRVAAYAEFGTDGLALNVMDALRDRHAALMANHGAITTGPSIDKALSLLPYLEYICEVHLRAMSTGRTIKILDDQQMADAVQGVAGYSPKSVDSEN